MKVTNKEAGMMFEQLIRGWLMEPRDKEKDAYILEYKKNDIETVRRICDVVQKFVPEYKEEEILIKILIDNACAYHIGASIKDAGKKCFGISRIEDTRIVKDILERLNLESEEADNE